MSWRRQRPVLLELSSARLSSESMMLFRDLRMHKLPQQPLTLPVLLSSPHNFKFIPMIYQRDQDLVERFPRTPLVTAQRPTGSITIQYNGFQVLSLALRVCISR